jgi:predicted CoA-binding protein
MDNTRFTSLIAEILNQRRFAVVGVSRDRNKYGYQVYKALKRAGYNVFAVNPNLSEIDGDPVYPYLDNIPEPVDVIVTVVPPEITQQIMIAASKRKIGYCWMQPGSESKAAVNQAIANGMRVVYGGPCIMVAAREYQAA